MLSLLLALGSVAEASSYQAAGAYAASVFSLAEASLLSYYRQDLYERYGIFALQTEEETLEMLAERYCKTSFLKDGNSDRMGILLEQTEVILAPFSLYRGELLKRNMAECMKRKLPLEILDWAGFQEGLRQLFGDAPEVESETDENTEELYCNRTLRNQTVKELLPSSRWEADRTGMDFKLPSNLDELIQNGKEEVLSTLYLLTYFNNHTTELTERTTFFCNEVEYILAGNSSDEANLQAVKAYLVLLRTGLNSLHIAEDPLKLEAAFGLAAAISGPGAIWTQAAVVAAWAAAEAICDVERLLEGKKVPFWKTAEDWILSIEGLTKMLQEGLEVPEQEDRTELQQERGMDYKAYLAMLLFLTGSEKKLTRAMDLMQLNLCGTSDKGFDFSRCYGGFRLTCSWRQNRHTLMPFGNRKRTYEQTVYYFPKTN